MTARNLSRHHPLLARASVWTIKHHHFLAGHRRIYVWYSSAVLLFLSVAGLVPLKAALTVLLFCGLSIMIILWALIVWRKMILLAISDEALKKSSWRRVGPDSFQTLLDQEAQTLGGKAFG